MLVDRCRTWIKVYQGFRASGLYQFCGRWEFAIGWWSVGSFRGYPYDIWYMKMMKRIDEEDWRWVHVITLSLFVVVVCKIFTYIYTSVRVCVCVCQNQCEASSWRWKQGQVWFYEWARALVTFAGKSWILCGPKWWSLLSFRLWEVENWPFWSY